MRRRRQSYYQQCACDAIELSSLSDMLHRFLYQKTTSYKAHSGKSEIHGFSFKILFFHLQKPRRLSRR